MAARQASGSVLQAQDLVRGVSDMEREHQQFVRSDGGGVSCACWRVMCDVLCAAVSDRLARMPVPSDLAMPLQDLLPLLGLGSVANQPELQPHKHRLLFDLVDDVCAAARGAGVMHCMQTRELPTALAALRDVALALLAEALAACNHV